ncbi:MULTISPECIES: tyramine oxidase [Flavobacteriaceae]|uniref:copper amine oxidase n=1 Tax=Flavobacteriaceae TaxID=49546 RepID=UPI00131C5D1D|nr:tyramine oxidase [Cellulophaga sp. L1A9]
MKKTILPFLFLFTLIGCEQENNEAIKTSTDTTTTAKIVQHPLDALTEAEILEVKEILMTSKKISETTRFPEITLLEPSKESVYAWGRGNDITRKAALIIRDDKKTYEAIVDISKEEVLQWEEIKDVQPSLMLEEWMQAGEIWKTDKRVTDALKERGYKIEDVAGAPLTTGFFGTETRDQRLLKVWLLDIKDIKRNLFAKPINGITPVVDINKGEVIDVLIDDNVGRNDTTYDYDEASVNAYKLKPVTLNSPEGDNFSFTDDGKITWDKWKFHLRMDKRFGAVVSLAEFDGQSVAYQISANEMFVPYQDASEDWKYRSYMDIGEYGFGLLSSALQEGTDVPDNATLLNAVIPMDDGTPLLYEKIIGIFERNTGRPLWRHAEFLNETHESRAEIELVVRTIPVVGNYDYVVDYVFSSKGILNIEVGATGMDAVKAAKAKTMSDPTAMSETRVGNLVAPNLIGVYHDHFLSFRIDLDVDGIQNSFATDEIVPVKYPNNTRKSGWEVVEHPELKEGAITENKEGHDGFWKVVNKNSKNSLGQHKSYQILGHSYLSVLDDEDYPQKRAAWSKQQLWVTPYDKSELYPSGKYPNQSDGSDGILKWIAQDRSIDNTDIVCWYTMGFHHITLPEDWPVLPTFWHSVTLRPAKSFDRNPAIEIGK